MKKIKLMFCAVLMLTFYLIGCEKLDIYSIDAPPDLQKNIDSIANAKANQNSGDTMYLTISTTIVGAEDNSSGWWTAFSDYFTIPANKLLHLEFINHTSGVNNWNNWNLAVVNVANRDAADYKEYFVLRSDAYGWGNGDYDASMIQHNYSDIDGDGDIWEDFRTTMQGASVTIDIDHSATGNVYVTATAIGINGTKLVETYQQPVSATDDIVAFLVCDGSYFQMKKAYLIPSKVTVVADVNPVSITIAGAPTSVELGNKNFWGDATATVTFADGSSEQIDSANLSFNVVPDMTTVGKKTVIVAYNKTKQGKLSSNLVSTYYTLDVTNSVASLQITTPPVITKYYYFSTSPITFNTSGLVVTATYSDGTTGIIPNTNLQFGNITAAAGTQSVSIKYVGPTSSVSTTCSVTLVKGIAQIGASDFSTPWWTAFSNEYTVASGFSKTITMYCYSDNLENYHSPSTILRNAAKNEYAVVRMDNYGWGGTGYSTAVLTSDWNWSTFASNISGSKVVIKVTNNGNNTADVLYNVTYANGETHFQKYAGITVNSSDLDFALVLEKAYIVIVE